MLYFGYCLIVWCFGLGRFVTWIDACWFDVYMLFINFVVLFLLIVVSLCFVSLILLFVCLVDIWFWILLGCMVACVVYFVDGDFTLWCFVCICFVERVLYVVVYLFVLFVWFVLVVCLWFWYVIGCLIVLWSSICKQLFFVYFISLFTCWVAGLCCLVGFGCMLDCVAA